MIGVTFGAAEHQDWCGHKGAVAVWNINRSDFDANQPERTIEASSCVLSLAFHPSNPALFAAGTFNGVCVCLIYSFIYLSIHTAVDSASNQSTHPATHLQFPFFMFPVPVLTKILNCVAFS